MLKSPKNYQIRIILVGVFVLVLIAGLFLLLNKPQTPSTITQNQISADKTVAQTTSKPKPAELPVSLRLQVPFTAQAPTANWDELHNQACEEASLIMAWAYFNNITSLPPKVVETEIAKLTDWQQTTYGYNLSVTTPETARMGREIYGLTTEVAKFDAKTIKQALAENKLVIVPAQGQELGNPNFTPPGPPYHMLVITGYYNKAGLDYFITNDPGTRRGENYEYSSAIIEAAAGNYSHTTEKVDTTNKDIIIVSK